MTAPIPVVVAGALGRMGAEVIKAVVGAQDCRPTWAWSWAWASLRWP